jgi:hypothetical protein
MRQDMQFLAANRYRDLKVASESEARRVMLGSLLEIERVIADALAGITPIASCGAICRRKSF